MDKSQEAPITLTVIYSICIIYSYFKSHFLKHKKLLENVLGTKYAKLEADAPRFLQDIEKIIDDGTVKFAGKGTLNKGADITNIYRGKGITVVTKLDGEWVTILEQGKAMDLNIKFIP
jgi:hypothetical protein